MLKLKCTISKCCNMSEKVGINQNFAIWVQNIQYIKYWIYIVCYSIYTIFWPIWHFLQKIKHFDCLKFDQKCYESKCCNLIFKCWNLIQEVGINQNLRFQWKSRNRYKVSICTWVQNVKCKIDQNIWNLIEIIEIDQNVELWEGNRRNPSKC